VVKTHRAHLRGGWTPVKVKHGHRSKGSGCLLAAHEEKEVQRHIQGRTPDQFEMSYAQARF